MRKPQRARRVRQDTLEEVLSPALFIPLLIDTGGNSGSQAAMVVIRAMAVGEVRFSDLPRVLKRELVVGVIQPPQMQTKDGDLDLLSATKPDVTHGVLDDRRSRPRSVHAARQARQWRKGS